MRKYGKQDKVVGRSVGKLLTSATTGFARLEMCISRANAKVEIEKNIKAGLL